MNQRSSMWFADSPYLKPTSLFNPQIIKQDLEIDPEESIHRPPIFYQQSIPSIFKFHAGPLSPWSSCVNPQNEHLSSQPRANTNFRDPSEMKEAIQERLIYSDEEEDLVTPIRQAHSNSRYLQDCDILTTGKKSEYGNAERQRKSRPKEKGLRQLSQKVYCIIQRLQKATYKEVAAKLLLELHDLNKDQKEQQNIKRRVYDALNVLISLGVLTKVGHSIFCAKNRKSKKDHEEKQSELHHISQQIALGQDIIAQKQNKLKQTQQKYALISRLLERNKRDRKKSEIVEFPYIGIMIKDNSGLNKQQRSEQQLMIESSAPLTLFGDIDTIKWLSQQLKQQVNEI